MASREVMGVSLSELEEPIHSAVSTYEERSISGLLFDARKACRLEPTPDKTNSARSESPVYLRGQTLGTLYIIAFKPGDGTGSEATHKLEDLEVDSRYPRDIRVVPRSKQGIRNETHLTILRHRLENVHAEPELFQGILDELTLEGNTVRKTYEIGQAVDTQEVLPLATLTTGYLNGERFGDPHAIYNSIPDYLQVCAFLAITDEIYRIEPIALVGINPQAPRKV